MDLVYTYLRSRPFALIVELMAPGTVDFSKIQANIADAGTRANFVYPRRHVSRPGNLNDLAVVAHIWDIVINVYSS